jgi:hypothetical protein
VLTIVVVAVVAVIMVRAYPVALRIARLIVPDGPATRPRVSVRELRPGPARDRRTGPGRVRWRDQVRQMREEWRD